jgi:hypothetical protein
VTAGCIAADRPGSLNVRWVGSTPGRIGLSARYDDRDVAGAARSSRWRGHDHLIGMRRGPSARETLRVYLGAYGAGILANCESAFIGA